MKASEIRIGGIYLAKVSNKIVQVRVDDIKDSNRSGGGHWNKSYKVTNLATKRTTSFRSAAKFRSEVVQKSKEPVAVAPEYPMPLLPKTATSIAKTKRQLDKQQLSDAQDAFLNGAVSILLGKKSGAEVVAEVNAIIQPKAAPETFSLVDTIDTPVTPQTPNRFRPLGSVEAGKLARIRFTHQEVEVIEQFAGSSTKVRILDTGKVTTMAPATECQIIEAPTQRQDAPAPASKQEGGSGATEAPASAQSKPAAAAKEKKAPAASAPKASVANSFGIKVEQTPSGRCTIFGESTSGVFRWAGSKGWSEDDCVKLTSALSLEGVSRSSFNILLKAGAKGFRLPSFTADQEAALLLAAGKVEAKKEKTPKAKTAKSKK